MKISYGGYLFFDLERLAQQIQIRLEQRDNTIPAYFIHLTAIKLYDTI